jgi:hypothetical protein
METDPFDYLDDQAAQVPDRRSDLVWNVLTILILLTTVCLGIVFMIVFINPQVAFNPFPPSTLPPTVALSTVTPTPRNPLPPTWTHTATIPSPPTTTPEPINTPLPTLEQPTATEVVTGAGMPYEVADNSPVYTQNIYHLDLGCAWMGLAGQAFDLSGAPVPGLQVEVGGRLGGQEVSLISLTGLANNFYGPAGYEFVLADEPIASTRSLWVQLKDQAGLPMSQKYFFDTFDDCERNLILINFTQVR